MLREFLIGWESVSGSTRLETSMKCCGLCSELQSKGTKSGLLSDSCSRLEGRVRGCIVTCQD
jgi:hypothetical protein